MSCLGDKRKQSVIGKSLNRHVQGNAAGSLDFEIKICNYRETIGFEKSYHFLLTSSLALTMPCRLDKLPAITSQFYFCHPISIK